MTKALDDGVGNINSVLKKLELEDNTFILFFNDNGGTRDNASSNGDLRGWKGSNFEGGIRVPCIFKWPGKLEAGKVYDNPISGLDFLPTAYAAAGGSKIIGKEFDGVNLLPYITGKTDNAPHDILFWRLGNNAAVREGNWKYVLAKDGSEFLFDLDRDRSETNDLSTKFPIVFKRLKFKLAQWEKELSPPKWTRGGGWIEYDIVKQLQNE
jgi:arylsulfatase A-like enzyme